MLIRGSLLVNKDFSQETLEHFIAPSPDKLNEDSDFIFQLNSSGPAAKYQL